MDQTHIFFSSARQARQVKPLLLPILPAFLLLLWGLSLLLMDGVRCVFLITP